MNCAKASQWSFSNTCHIPKVWDFSISLIMRIWKDCSKMYLWGWTSHMISFSTGKYWTQT